MERFYRLVAPRPRAVAGSLAVRDGHPRRVLAPPSEIDSSISALFAEGDPRPPIKRRSESSSEARRSASSRSWPTTSTRRRSSRRFATSQEPTREGRRRRRVVSLTTAVDPVADVFAPPLLMPEVPRDEAGRRALLDKLRERPRIYCRRILVAEGRAGDAINLFFAKMDEGEFVRRGIDPQSRGDRRRVHGPGEALYRASPLQAYLRQAMRAISPAWCRRRSRSTRSWLSPVLRLAPPAC